jgi:hypothetical protein
MKERKRPDGRKRREEEKKPIMGEERDEVAKRDEQTKKSQADGEGQGQCQCTHSAVEPNKPALTVAVGNNRTRKRGLIRSENKNRSSTIFYYL